MSDELRSIEAIPGDAEPEWGALDAEAASSPAFRSAVSLVRRTAFPCALFWGPELRMAYNEAYVELIGDKHPAAHGARARDVFPEAWEAIEPWFAQALAGRTVQLDDALVPLERHGFLEDCWFSFCYSPVLDEQGGVVGVLDIAVDTTERVVDSRRLELLARLADELGQLDHVDEIAARAGSVLAEGPGDFPAATVTLGHEGTQAALPAGSKQPQAGALDVISVDGDRTVVLGLGQADLLGVLIARLSPGLAADEDYLDFVRLVGATITQAVDRVSARESERELSESLQRSLLGRPVDLHGLEVSACYQPAASQAFVGGDWYDAFPLADRGSVLLCIGDVAGHDREAAAAMSQARNLLRGIALSLDGPPARVLERLDRSMDALEVDVAATAAVVEIVPPVGAAPGRMRWSNAGHPPPVLVRASGEVEVLERVADLLLGAGATGAERVDHEVRLDAGDQLVLVTDGLIERRGAPLDTGLRWLRSALEGAERQSAQAVCRRLLELIGRDVEDDAAVLVARIC